MSKNCLPVVFAFLALAANRGANAHPLQGNKDRVAALILEADKMPLDKAWSVLNRIHELGLSEDSTLSALQKSTGAVGIVGRLVIARALLDLGDDGLYGQKAVELLAPILHSAKAGAGSRIAAAELLGDKRLDGKARLIAGRALAKVTKDDTANAMLRLSAAKALLPVATATQMTLARRTLLAFLRSNDRRLRVQGALAIFEAGDGFESAARGVLEEIESEPTVEGRLARAYLDRERRQREYELMQRRMSQLLIRNSGGNTRPRPRSDRLDELRELMQLIEAAHIDGNKVKKDDLVESAAAGMLKGLDRFSSYLSSDSYARFAFDLNRQYGGIGAFVRVDEDGIFKITRPIYSGPAYKAGLMSEDRIYKVDGWDTADQDLDEIIRRLKGKPGTPVRIDVYRAGWPDTREMTLTRAAIQVPSVNDIMLPGKIGYVELITFGAETSQELRTALAKLEKQGARAFVMDLRGNSGGYLQQAQLVADAFLPKDKMIVYTKSRIEKQENFFSRNPPIVAPDVPLVVLVDGTSASASEIVSGALQDHKRATIVGLQTYGKGSVQNLFRLRSRPGEPFVDENRDRRWNSWESYTDENKNGKFDPGPRARVTIARYYLPSGRCLHKIIGKNGKVVNPDYGVMPNVKVAPRRLKATELWKNAAIAELWRQRKFHDYVKQHWAGHEELFTELALSDRGQSARYPEFDAFYKSLKTQLDKDDIRRWIRVVVRDRVADKRGKAWPGIRVIGDYEEDRQLQGAIAVALRQLGEHIDQYAEFKPVLKLPKDFGAKQDVAKKK